VTAPLLVGRPSDRELTEKLISTVWRGGPGWRVGFLITGLGTLFLVGAIGYTVFIGVGVWGINIPVAWAFAITNFVWWIGIGHAGTLISAFLLLLEQKWRTSINRIAEAMTLFAVIQAGLFPILHLGRPWFAYWLVPYPAQMKVWPQWKSALPWDAAAVSTYFTVSLLFWYVGLLPDLASVRDTAPTRARRILYGIFALGWRGSARDRRHYRLLYGILAGLATPLVVSVHSIVSTDFAIALVPGWHATIFPPYFVAGAIFSGFAMVITLLVPLRRVLGLEQVVTLRHFDNIARLTLATAWIVAYSYAQEFFLAWFSGDTYEQYTHFVALPFGHNGWIFWTAIACNVVVPQLLWSAAIRRRPMALWFIALLINLGMWSERFMIIVLALQREYLPSKWHAYSPTWVDWSILVGTLFFFLFLFLAFARFVPVVPVAEVKELRDELAHEGHA
jgi:molybdopterin-containing oxidoreductase family membrane subunit